MPTFSKTHTLASESGRWWLMCKRSTNGKCAMSSPHICTITTREGLEGCTVGGLARGMFITITLTSWLRTATHIYRVEVQYCARLPAANLSLAKQSGRGGREEGGVGMQENAHVRCALDLAEDHRGVEHMQSEEDLVRLRGQWRHEGGHKKPPVFKEGMGRSSNILSHKVRRRVQAKWRTDSSLGNDSSPLFSRELALGASSPSSVSTGHHAFSIRAPYEQPEPRESSPRALLPACGDWKGETHRAGRGGRHAARPPRTGGPAVGRSVARLRIGAASRTFATLSASTAGLSAAAPHHPRPRPQVALHCPIRRHCLRRSRASRHPWHGRCGPTRGEAQYPPTCGGALRPLAQGQRGKH
eukprot:scaffold158956_cov30-Tisochrysis_lutea.AAC.2